MCVCSLTGSCSVSNIEPILDILDSIETRNTGMNSILSRFCIYGQPIYSSADHCSIPVLAVDKQPSNFVDEQHRKP